MWAANGTRWQAEYLGLDLNSGFERQVRQRVDSPAGLPPSSSSIDGAAEEALVADAAAGSNSAAVSGEDAPGEAQDELQMPSAAQLPAWIKRVVDAHGPSAVVALLLKECPADVVRDACDRAWGVQPSNEDEHSARVRSSVSLRLTWHVVLLTD